MRDNLVGRSEHLDFAVAKPQTAMAHSAEVSHLVIYHDHGMALFEDRFYPLKAFLFERRVAHRNARGGTDAGDAPGSLADRIGDARRA